MAARDVEAGRAHVLLSIRDKLSQGLKLAERRLQTFGTYVATTAGTIAAGGAGALAWPLKLSADMEQAAVSFEVFLGSAEKAKALIAEVETMAARTPFQFDELRDTTQMLLQFGVPLEDVLQQVRNLGDVSGGNSEKLGRLALAFGQVMAKGRLMGQEVMQMTENGFNPLQEISRTTGRTMKDLMAAMENGEISSQMLANAFATAAGTGGRFSNMMDKQSATLTGLVSTLMDYSKMALRAFGDTLVPLFKDVMKVGISAAQGISAFVAANKELVAGVAKIILIVTAVAGAFLALGVASLSLSFTVGIIASGFAMISAIAGTVISVFGAIAGVVGTSVAMIATTLGLMGSASLVAIQMLVAIPGIVTAAWAGLTALTSASIALSGAMRLLSAATVVTRVVFAAFATVMASMRLSVMASTAATHLMSAALFTLRAAGVATVAMMAAINAASVASVAAWGIMSAAIATLRVQFLILTVSIKAFGVASVVLSFMPARIVAIAVAMKGLTAASLVQAAAMRIASAATVAYSALVGVCSAAIVTLRSAFIAARTSVVLFVTTMTVARAASIAFAGACAMIATVPTIFFAVSGAIAVMRSAFSLASIQAIAYSVATGIATASTTVFSGAVATLTSIMSFGLAAAPLLVVAGLVALAGYFAYTSGVGGRAMDAIGSGIGTLRNSVTGLGTNFIASARSFVTGMVAPLISGFKSIWTTFSTTFGAVKAAFLDGQLVTAANIAWLGVQAVAWQAAASMGESITYVLDALSTWIPGFGAVRDYIGSVIGSIGQAILSGQWELAAAIAMAKVQLAVLIPWNYIAATFSHVTTGMMIAWDYFSYAIGEAFTRGSDIIVDGINWLYDKFLWLQKAWANLTGDMELAVSTTKAQKDMEDYKKILQDTREGQRNARAAGLEKSVNDRSAANQSAAAARGKQETDLQDKIKSLEKDAAAAAGVAGSGGGTLQGNANVAKAKLDAATRAAEAERKAREAQGAEVAKLGSSGIKPLGGSDGKIAGSFSAAAAVALGSGGNNTAQKQLTYTQRIAALMEENNRKKGAVFT
jgi:tape measure domain-containing protein